MGCKQASAMLIFRLVATSGKEWGIPVCCPDMFVHPTKLPSGLGSLFPLATAWLRRAAGWSALAAPQGISDGKNQTWNGENGQLLAL